jgi:hypothetical protein
MKKVVLSFVVLGCLTLATARAAEHKAAPAGAAKGAEPTCGQMIAGMAAIPAKLSEGASTVADVLEAHAALMGSDKAAAAEVKGMHAVAKTHKQLAASLLKASEEMKKATAWPAAPHDMNKMMSDPKLAEANKRLVEIHKELIAMFQKMVNDAEAQHKAN